jgi:hypothetical protein
MRIIAEAKGTAAEIEAALSGAQGKPSETTEMRNIPLATEMNPAVRGIVAELRGRTPVGALHARGLRLPISSETATGPQPDRGEASNSNSSCSGSPAHRRMGTEIVGAMTESA